MVGTGAGSAIETQWDCSTRSRPNLVKATPSKERPALRPAVSPACRQNFLRSLRALIGSLPEEVC